MKRPIHILYIPGFGDKYDPLRLRLLKWWRFRDVTIELVPMQWDVGTFDKKIARIDRAIDRTRGKRIVLIGESAGGSMAIHVYARRSADLHGVMTVCGKNAHPETVRQRYFDRSPAFKTSMDRLNGSLAKLTPRDNERFVSIHPFYDPVVPVRETLLPNCRRVRLWAVGHMMVILLALTVFSPLLVRAARK